MRAFLTAALQYCFAAALGCAARPGRPTPATRRRRTPRRPCRRRRSRGGCESPARPTASQRSGRAATPRQGERLGRSREQSDLFRGLARTRALPVSLRGKDSVGAGASPAEHRADAADDGRALGAQPHRHALHPHARVRAAGVRDRPLRRRGRDLPRDRDRRRALAPDPPLRPAARRARGALPLAEPALVRLRAREDERVDDRADPRRDADLRGADRARVRPRAAVAAVLARRRQSRSRASASSRSERRAASRGTRAARCSGSRPRRPGPLTRSRSRR